MAIESTTPVPTADGWKRAHELNTKDVVFNQKGKPQPVLTVQKWIPSDCYEVHFDDGLTIVGDRQLGFPCQTKNWREHFCRWLNRKTDRKPRELTSAIWEGKVRDILDQGLVDETGRKRFAVAAAEPLRFAPVDLPVPPYVLGVFLSTLGPTGRHWLRKKHDLERIRAKMRTSGHAIATRKHKNGQTMMEFRPSMAASFSVVGSGAPDIIPMAYMNASMEQRTELLDGILDGKGLGKEKATMSSQSWTYIRRVQGLVESLGYKTKLSTRSDRGGYSLEFMKKPAKARRYLTKIEKAPVTSCVHVVCDQPFLAGEGFIAVC